LSGGFAQDGEVGTRAYNAPHYATPEDAKQESVVDNIKSAARKYKEDLTQSSDPLVEKVSDIATSAADTAKTIAENMRKRFEK
jgi:hypothetical protein